MAVHRQPVEYFCDDSGTGTGTRTLCSEEIVVTAQKRSESVQDVPIAVTAMTAEMRDLMGVISIGELTDFTPGLFLRDHAGSHEPARRRATHQQLRL